MKNPEWQASENPSAQAVRFGRAMFFFIGAVLVGVGGWVFLTQSQAFAFTLLGIGVILVLLGFFLPRKIVAHFGFELPWFLP